VKVKHIKGEITMRLFTFFTSFFLFYAFVSFAQTATPPSGAGTSLDPYLISSVDNLYWITQNSSEWVAGKYFQQTADIDASSSSTWDAGAGLSPIGNSTTNFDGNYDGNNHSISGLTINRGSTDYIGLFGYVSNPTIQSLSLSSVNITGRDYTGALVGYSKNGTSVTNCNSTGTVSGRYYVGGLIGSTDGTISNCFSSALITATYAGGLIGINYQVSSFWGTITSCYATGTVNGSFKGGGLVAINEGVIDLCYATGQVNVTASGADKAGGLVGDCSGGTIKKSYSTGYVDGSGASYVGGLIGLCLDGTITDCYSLSDISVGVNLQDGGGFAGIINGSSNISNCYSTGAVPASSKTGGFAFLLNVPATINNSFWDTITSGQSTSGGGTGKTTAEMKTQSTFTAAGWDFTTIWQMIGSNYPDLQSNSNSALPVELTSFTAVSTSSTTIVLNWQTATEVNNYGFEIQRASSLPAGQAGSATPGQDESNLQGQGTHNGNSDLEGYTKIGFVQGHGNSNSPKQYSFTDNTATNGNYSYRLKQIDTDGQFEYSDVVEVTTGSIPTKYALQQNYPNPFNPATTIKYLIPENGFVTLKVFDVLGKEVARLVNANQQPGNYSVNFDASNLPSGTYIYTIRANNFFSSKKMLLMK